MSLLAQMMALGEDGEIESENGLFYPVGETPVTLNNAQKIATVFSCINIKANALCVIPLKTYIYTKKGKADYISSKLYNLLRYEPNPNLTASLYKKMISQDLDLRGNHYSQIVRNGLGEVSALYPLVADSMQVSFSANGKKVYIYNGKTLKSHQVLHIFDIPDKQGLKGLSRIEYAKESLQFAKNSGKYGNEIFKNATAPSGAFEMAGELGDEAYKRLKTNLNEKYAGLKNAGTPLLLEGGLTFKPLSLKNSDAEWLESRRFNREEVASIFGVPVAMLNDSVNTAYGNLEQKYLEFYSGTILPVTTILEEQFRQSLLSKDEKKFVNFKFKYNAMLRVDTKTRADYYKTRFDIGSISPNEVRRYEDENKIDDGDEHYVQLNLSTLKNINKGGINNG